LTQPKISVFGHSTELTACIILTEGDINILFIYISNKNILNYFRQEIDADQGYHYYFECEMMMILLLVVVLQTVVGLFHPFSFDHVHNEGGLLIKDS